MSLQEIKKDGSYITAKAHIVPLDCEIDVVIMSGNIDYAESCLNSFNSISDELLLKLKKYTMRYCEDFRQFFDENSPDVPEGVSENDIFDYVNPRVLIVYPPKDTSKPAFGIELGCEWEKEHGVEWVFNDGELLYVGDFVGISPWYSRDRYKRECMNYVYFEHCI